MDELRTAVMKPVEQPNAKTALRSYLSHRGVTQDEIATVLGLSQATVSRKLNPARREDLRLSELQAISNAIGCTIIIEPMAKARS